MQRSLNVTKVISADTTDLLNNTILQSIPREGTLVVEASATECSGDLQAKITIQEPDGHVPINNMPLPAGGYAYINAARSEATGAPHVTLTLDDRTERMWQFEATEGGHFTIAIDIAGDNVGCIVAVTLVWDDEEDEEEEEEIVEEEL